MKKTICIALAIVIFIIPTVAAVFFYFVPDISERSTENETAGALALLNGESYSFDEKNNVFLTEFFKQLESNSAESLKIYDNLPIKNEISAQITSNGEDKTISLFFSLDGECFWADEDKNVYKIDQSYADSFLNSQYAKSFYEFSSMPTLRIASGDSITPSSAEWKYTLKNGAVSDGSEITVTDTVDTYYSTSLTGIYFSIVPDICDVKAYVDGTKVYDGSLDGLASSELDNEPIVKFEINATWSKGSDTTYFGSATYSFEIEQTTDAVFSLDKEELMQGEFITVSAQNITDLSNLSCSVFPFIDYNFTDDEGKSKFVKNGNDAYALIPFHLELEAGTYILILRYENTQQVFRINLIERESRDQEDLELTFTDTELNELNTLIESVGKDVSDTVYASGTFYNYENDFGDDYYIRLGFGHIRKFGNDKDFRLNGVDFYRPTGENIPALNNGIVCKIGEDEFLGKYVVVDHGYGVKSWYCHVGEITVSERKSVIKGDTVARTGMSGLTSSPGFYLITTIYDVPVSPYKFYENNFVFPN